MKSRFAIIVVLASFLMAVSASTAQDKPVTADKKGTAVQQCAAACYSCPMHPTVTADKAGKCSQCGMELTKKKSETSLKCAKMSGKKTSMKGCCGETCGQGCGDK